MARKNNSKLIKKLLRRQRKGRRPVPPSYTKKAQTKDQGSWRRKQPLPPVKRPPVGTPLPPRTPGERPPSPPSTKDPGFTRPAWQDNPKYDLAKNFRGTRKQANKYGLAEPQLRAVYTAGPGKGKSALIPDSKRGSFVGIKNGMVGMQLSNGVMWTQKGGTVYDKGGLGGNPGHGGKKRKVKRGKR